MSENRGYHAHIYYDSNTKPKAAQLREVLLEKFKVEPGGFSDEPRPAPHLAVQRDFRDVRVPGYCAMADAQPGWLGRAGAPADRKLL
jgi:aromatic ring-cleaving dioxygenase